MPSTAGRSPEPMMAEPDLAAMIMGNPYRLAASEVSHSQKRVRERDVETSDSVAGDVSEPYMADFPPDGKVGDATHQCVADPGIEGTDP